MKIYDICNSLYAKKVDIMALGAEQHCFLVKEPSAEETLELCSFARNALFCRMVDDGLILYGTHKHFNRLLAQTPVTRVQRQLLQNLRNFSSLLSNIDTPCVEPKTLVLSNKSALSLQKPLIMGIINTTPDSFYSGSRKRNPETALSEVSRMISQGADIVDIGGESSRPGSMGVDRETEESRVIPVIKEIRKHFDIPVSVDTCKASVARRAIDEGADLINDISALRNDPEMVEVVSRNKVPVVLMHMKGSPKNMQKNPVYNDVLGEIMDFFADRIQYALTNGIDREQIILDPGIGFGKRLTDNLKIMKHLEVFKKFGLPVLLGASRKSFLKGVLNQDNPSERLNGTMGTTALGVQSGAHIFRVHDVGPNREVADLAHVITHV